MEARAWDERADEVSAGRLSGRARTALTVLAIAAGVVLAAYAVRMLLLVFAGVLFGVFLDAVTSFVMRWTRLGHRIALTSVVALLTVVGAAIVLLVAPSVIEQASSMLERVPDIVRQVRGSGSRSLQQMLGQVGTVAQPVLRSASAVLGFMGSLVIVAFIGLYVAARPTEYSAGLIRLFPPEHRDRVREVLHHCARQVRRWMMGAGIAMLSAGILTGLGLWLLGAPFALALGVLAGVFELVPNVGPLAAAALAVLLSLVDQGGPRWWHVVLLFAVIQTLQSYVVQPLTQRYLVDVPPALGIGAVVLFGWLVGPIGVVVGIPLLIVTRVVVKVVYWRDTLGERVELAA